MNMYCPVTYSKQNVKTPSGYHSLSKDGNKDEKLMSPNRNTPDCR